MNFNLMAEDRDKLIHLLADQEEWRVSQWRSEFLSAALGDSPRKDDIVRQVDLSGAPGVAASRAVDYLHCFGQDLPGHEVLALLIRHLLGIRGGGIEADFLQGMLERYPLTTSSKPGTPQYLFPDAPHSPSLPPTPERAFLFKRDAFSDIPLDIGMSVAIPRSSFLTLIAGTETSRVYESLLRAERALFDAQTSPGYAPVMPVRWWLRMELERQNLPSGPQEESQVWDTAATDVLVQSLKQRSLAGQAYPVMPGLFFRVPATQVERQSALLANWINKVLHIFQATQVGFVIHVVADSHDRAISGLTRLIGDWERAISPPMLKYESLSYIPSIRNESIARPNFSAPDNDVRSALIEATASDESMDEWVQSSALNRETFPQGSELYADAAMGPIINTITLALLRAYQKGERSSEIQPIIEEILQPRLSNGMKAVCNLCMKKYGQEMFLNQYGANEFMYALRAGAISPDPDLLHLATLDRPDFWWLITALPPIGTLLKGALALPATYRTVLGLCHAHEWEMIKADPALAEQVLACRRYRALQFRHHNT